jgi:hypothetical protein
MSASIKYVMQSLPPPADTAGFVTHVVAFVKLR